MRFGPQRRTLLRLRRHLISKISAATFIALVLIPFTAPFPSYFLDGAPGTHPFDADVKDLRTKTETAAGVCVVPGRFNLTDLQTAERRPRSTRVRPALTDLVRHEVLRI